MKLYGLVEGFLPPFFIIPDVYILQAKKMLSHTDTPWNARCWDSMMMSPIKNIIL